MRKMTLPRHSLSGIVPKSLLSFVSELLSLSTKTLSSGTVNGDCSSTAVSKEPVVGAACAMKPLTHTMPSEMVTLSPGMAATLPKVSLRRCFRSPCDAEIAVFNHRIAGVGMTDVHTDQKGKSEPEDNNGCRDTDKKFP